MCFSPQASFSASIALTGIGVASVKKIKNKREIPLALVPFFFALHQFSEGILWLNLLYFKSYSMFASFFTYSFYFFVTLIWPIYCPITILLIEKDNFRRKLIKISLIPGVLLGIYYLVIVISHGATTSIVNQSLYHGLNGMPFSNPTFWTALYVFFTTVAAFISSNKIINAAGFVLIISFIIAYIFYFSTFLSIWCFFALPLNLLIFYYFKTKK